MKPKFFGWKRELPDIRDKHYSVSRVTVPVKDVDFRKTMIMPAIKDQGQLGSCTGNGWAFAIEFNMLNKQVQKVDLSKVPFSRLFIYYNERAIEGTTSYDSGAYIRDGIKTISAQGVCSEKVWPYTISKFKNKPTTTAYSEALNFKSVTYLRVDNTVKSQIQDALNNNYPIVFGFTVYDSFMTDAVAKNGVVPMPKKSESVQGGHCTVIIGYDTKTDRYICANSWETSWGQKGYYTIPASYLTNSNLASDFWVSKLIL